MGWNDDLRIMDLNPEPAGGRCSVSAGMHGRLLGGRDAAGPSADAVGFVGREEDPWIKCCRHGLVTRGTLTLALSHRMGEGRTSTLGARGPTPFPRVPGSRSPDRRTGARLVSLSRRTREGWDEGRFMG